ncbi:alpha/beta hydrolase [Bacillaceae bacterium SIJ1]|uniref:alpha/beta hydrolase n=1 Tax=Litoribacterium kuwaitense TaxID=1398745 RepID=UPI0013EBC3C5|nr:alpha/beta hydrolase [Litoribacterium kuwaitense]NGP44622.1 alpha/beta hydrolase [Litoribacterium kuwaitense]
MLTETFQLDPDQPSITLTSYILEQSKEITASESRPAVLICPGGGYLYTSDREAEPLALRFAAAGFHAFVLRYHTGSTGGSVHPQPLLDAAASMKLIRERADEWHIDPDRIAVCGFSAGGHLAATLGVHWQDELLSTHFDTDAAVFKPNALILGYPVINFLYMKKKMTEEVTDPQMMKVMQDCSTALIGTDDPSDEELEAHNPARFVTDQTPPAFLWHTSEDTLVFAENSLQMATALAEKGVPYELHVFENGPHGLSLATDQTAREAHHINTSVEPWFNMAMTWLRKHLA